MTRRILIILLSALFFLIVAFGVIMGAFALADAMQDALGAKVLLWVGRSCLMLIALDLILLIGVLGVHVLLDQRDRGQDSGP